MTGFHKALHAFWGQFTSGGVPVPAYVSGRVPDGAAFPYITYELTLGAFGGLNILTAYCWHQEKSGVNVMAERAALLDQIARAIPPGGTTLAWDGGGAALYRNPAGFQSYSDVASEKPGGLPVLGGRTSYEIHYYNA